MVNIESYNKLKNQIGSATMVAVSKLKSQDDIKNLYDAGHRDFGENYVQELIEKAATLPSDTRWHFIGHLQRNKVKYIAPFIHLIQSVDSIKLLQEINKEAVKSNRIISVLIQVYLGAEESKYGLDAKQLMELLEYYTAAPQEYAHVHIQGLMGMSTLTDDKELVLNEFKDMEELFSIVKTQFFFGHDRFNTLSMGMSDDYDLALAAGSNMVRLGSVIFGKRI